MHRTAAKPFPKKSLKQRIQRLIQTKVWGTDIHPSAWIAETALIDRTWPKGVHIEADCFIDEEAVVLTHDMTRGIYVDTRDRRGHHRRRAGDHHARHHRG
jgi:hypothetical protein